MGALAILVACAPELPTDTRPPLARDSDGPCALPAPLITADPVSRIPDRYMVFYLDTVSAPAALTDRLETRHGFRATIRFEQGLKGFAAKLTPVALASIRCEPAVRRAEEDTAG